MKYALYLFLMAFAGSLFAQNPTSWKREIEAAHIFLPGNNGLTQNLNYRWKANKGFSWNRVDVDFRTHHFPYGVYYQREAGLTSDSGQTFQVNVTYGKEYRRLMTERLALQLGLVAGAGYKWNHVVTSVWANDNLNEVPAREVLTDDYGYLRAAPYLGLMVWGSKWVGFSGQIWLPTELVLVNNPGTNTLELNQQLEFRLGLTLRLYPAENKKAVSH